MSLSKQLRPRTSVKRSPKKGGSLWFERIMAIIAFLNYALVVFDFTYVPLRDFWLQGRVRLLSINLGGYQLEIPEEPIVVHRLPITQAYDWVKAIEPHRDTEAYLRRVEELEEELIQTSLRSPEVAEILEDLRQLSDEMIDTNPFLIANKTGTLEQIKNIMREHIWGEDGSSKEAFSIFWSQEHLATRNAIQELNFFNRKIRPLMETNYFRPIGENGRPVNNFGLLDFPFALIFFSEFLLRSWFISRRHTGVSWFDAMLWRWYDILLFAPVFFGLRSIRLLRILPVLIRLNQANLIDLKAIKKQASQGFVAGIAEDLTEVVVVGILNQVQGSIQRGELTDLLAQRNKNPYINLNDINEVAEISRLIVQLIINQVLPATREDLEAIIHHGLDKAIADIPGYQNFSKLPGVENLTQNIIEQTIHQVYSIVYTQIQHILEEDPEFDRLLDRLISTFTKSMSSEIQAQESMERMEYLLHALIEEIKVNYVQRLSEEDMEALLDQTRALRQAAQATMGNSGD
ncbi:hypothetical protein K4A83_21470 [Spirulina subsalsa FACHB-351]|uniref:Uridine phosphorylase n=2 Tax=Spirulina subsalsa TaxID=54311 RepID=A0ABT3LBC9_9CYAN|nr:hypothetical protein [Spirulina subsalsa FACHB-351]